MARRTSSPTVVGRLAELATFDVALADAQAGRTRILLVGGEAGIGKTRLVGAFAARARSQGCTVLEGVSPPAPPGAAAPYAGLTQALRSLVRSLDARELDAVLGPARHDLAALLPELGRVTWSDRDPFAQARLLEAILVAFERAAARAGPLLLIQEDLQFADVSTRAAIAFLCRNLVDQPVVLVVTYRTRTLSTPPDPLFDLLGELDRFASVERFELARLEDADIRRQLAGILGEAAPADVCAMIARRSDGIPFLVEELAFTRGDDDQALVPTSVRALVSARLSRISLPAQELVRVVALSSIPLPPSVLAGSLATPGTLVDAWIEEAAEQQLLVVRLHAGELTVGIRHVLVREALVAATPDSAARRLRLALAGALGSEAPPPPLGALEWAILRADLLRAAGAQEAAIPATLTAAALAQRVLAFAEADMLFGRALDLLDSDDGAALPGQELRGTLESAAEAASLAGRPSRAVGLLERALGMADSRTDAVEDQVRTRVRLGRYLGEANRADDAHAVLSDALDRAEPGSRLHLRILLRLGSTQLMRRDDESARAVAAVAIELARSLGARSEEREALSTLGVALMHLGRSEEAARSLVLARLLEGAPGPVRTEIRPSWYPDLVRGYMDRGAILVSMGAEAEAADHLLAGVDAATKMGLGPTWRPLLAASAARARFRSGEWEDVARLLEAVDHADADGAPEGRIVRAMLAVARGDWDDADRSLRAVGPLALGPGPGWAGAERAVEASLALWRRRPVEARREAAMGLGAATRAGEPAAVVELAALALEVEAVAVRTARSRHAGREVAMSREVATTMWAHVEGQPLAGPRERAHRAEAAAQLTRVTGPGDADAWRVAIEAWEAAGDPYRVALAGWHAADVLLEGNGSRSEVVRQMRESLAIAEPLAATPLVRALEALARRARLVLRPVGRGPVSVHDAAHGPAPPAPTHGLSARELEVLRLVAEGLTDREIAQALFIAEKTAGHHVSSILAKLDVSRRGEAAVVAHRRGLLGTR